MKKLKIFETFSGIGSQHKALTNLFKNSKYKELLKNKGFEVKYTSDWYINAIIGYDAIHYGGQDGFKVPSKEEMLKFLENFNFSRDSKNPYKFDTIKKWKDEDIKKLYIAFKRTKNLGSITDIKGEDVKGIDLLTYSFPCQDLSIAGKQAGIKKGDTTRSGLLWEIERILIEMSKTGKLPKFLLMENVKALLQKQFLDDFKVFEKFLEDLGYMNTRIVLKGSDFGVPQARERVFLISELGGKTNFQIEKENNTPKLGEYLNWKSTYKDSKMIEEYENVRKKDVPSRRGVIYNSAQKVNYNTPFVNTITTKADRNQSIIVEYGQEYFVEDKTKLDWRFLTSREALLLMGFDNEDYEKLKNAGIIDTEIYKQSGNSIIVQVLEKIFLEMLKRF